jgi:probable F420-dependent oxidoreductase
VGVDRFGKRVDAVLCPRAGLNRRASEMKLGVNLLNFGPGGGSDALLRWAQRSEELGYDSVMVSDHVAVTRDVAESYPEPFQDPFVTLAWLAGQTKRIRLGTTVIILPYRHPALTARLAADIDHMCGGRLIFGLGVGWSPLEFAALGVPFETRGRMTDEYIEVMKALWVGDGEVSYEGQTVSFEGVSAVPPLQSPHPPIWVGGNTRAGMRRAARYGDAWHPINQTRQQFSDGASELGRIAGELGRPVPALCPRIQLKVLDADAEETDRVMGIGSLAQVLDDLSYLQDSGSEHVTLDRYVVPDMEATTRHEAGLELLATLAGRLIN